MTNRRPRIGECTYCGARGTVTSDHVPPKGLFAKPRPKLITVPSCDRCNRGASTDDEYFRVMLNFHDTAGDHPDARGVRATVFRALDRPDSGGLRHRIAKATRQVDVLSSSGIYIGRRLGFDVDLVRLDRVVARVLKGLYFKEKGQRLPEGFTAEVYSEDGLRGISPDSAEEMRRELIRPALATAPRVIGNNVLRYWVAFASDHPYVSGWLFQFYGRVNFVGVTVPNDRLSSRGHG